MPTQIAARPYGKKSPLELSHLSLDATHLRNLSPWIGNDDGFRPLGSPTSNDGGIDVEDERISVR